MIRRNDRRICAGLLIMFVGLAGCAHQREAFFPPARPGSLFGPPATASKGDKSTGAGTATARSGSSSAKSGHVEQSASRATMHDDLDRFDFDYDRQ